MKVYQAINAVQKDLSSVGITKDRRNQAQGYSFRGIDDCYNAISPLLAKHGLCILPRVLGRDVREVTNAKGTLLFYTSVTVEYDFVSTEDGSKHTISMFGEAMDSGDKATNKAMSAAYKYAVMQAFSIPTEGDHDTENQTHEVVQGLTSNAIADLELAISESDTMDALQKVFAASWKKASALQQQKIKFMYDNRKKELAA
ncbi:Essential recombination function protein [uncultured Caudovirales phage]|uniref:Essential recombination function protein n=1 Tax=uncultured Caudovirales phage TaxID=2100421 RepID=A0A6J7WA20_9CAUD|nr:Essential recombination function protein [uncultured Caudovirales phage]